MEIGLLNHGAMKTKAMVDPCCQVIKQFALPEKKKLNETLHTSVISLQ
jgi:hypothetical protein